MAEETVGRERKTCVTISVGSVSKYMVVKGCSIEVLICFKCLRSLSSLRFFPLSASYFFFTD